MDLAISMSIALRDGKPSSGVIKATPASTSRVADDEEAHRLTVAVAQGHEAAFAELYDRYHARLLRLAMVLSHGDAALAQDVVQSAMLTAAAKLKPVRTEKHLWHWLARVAHQHLIKAWRRQCREPVLVDLNEWAETVASIESESILEQSLDAALSRLEEDDRQTVEWFYFDDLSHLEIARRLNTTTKAVSSRLERARAKLRAVLTRMLTHET